MNTRMIVSAVAVFLCSLGLFSANSLARDKVTADEARKIAKEAYIFTYPLVMMCRTMYLQAID